MNRSMENTINYVRRYLLKNYNHFIIDINDKFIGCKFYKGEYYIFFISIYEDKITLTYRMDFTEKEVIRLIIEDIDDASLAVFINQVMNTALNKNETLINKMKILPHSLVNYQYKEKTSEKSKKEDSKEEKQTIENKEKKEEFIDRNTKIIEKKQIEEIEILDDDIEELKDIKQKISEEINRTITEEELNLSLENINMSNRLRNCMMNNNITTLRDFLKLDLDKIKDFRNLGEKSATEAAYLLVALKVNLKDYILDTPSKKEAELEINIKDELLENVYSKISVDECEFSVRLLNCLQQNNILTLKDLLTYPNDDLKKLDNLGKKSYEEAVEYKTKIYLEINSEENKLDFLVRVIKVLTKENEISIISLKNFLMNNSDYPTDNLINDINLLRSKNLIVYTMSGIKCKEKSLMQVIAELDEEKKLLLSDRLEGKTLQELGDARGITRERIRQKLVKIFDSIPIVEEDKYKKLFEEYYFSEEEFNSIFHEDKYVYYYLKEKYSSGSKDISEGLKDSRFNEQQKEVIRGLRKIIKLFDDTIVVNKYNIIKSLVKQYAKKTIETEKFTDIYNDFIKKNNYNISLLDSRTMEGTLARIGEAVFGLGRRFRYYDYNGISQEDYDSLKEIFTNLETGFYSTLVICNNYKELMSSLDIKDEYELHNLCKNLFSELPDITFDRMPHFSIKGVTKDEFIEEKIKELAPISLSDFCQIMEEEYGHKSATVTWHVTNNLQQYNEYGVLKTSINLLSEEIIEDIKNTLTKPIYCLEDVKEILKNKGYTNINEIVNTTNMYKIGYRVRSSYIYKKEISSIEEYFRNIAENNDFIQNDNILKNSTYFTMMKKIEKTYDIFLISSDEYITIRKLKELGVEKEDIVEFCNEVKDKNYFTLSNVKSMININKLDDFGFDDIFFENIIGNIDEVTYIKFSSNKIFSFNNKEIDGKKFIIDCIGNKPSVFIEKLQDEINDNYGIEVTQEKIKNAIMDTDMYISDMLNKIYQNKEIYYEEVYDYE